MQDEQEAQQEAEAAKEELEENKEAWERKNSENNGGKKQTVSAVCLPECAAHVAHASGRTCANFMAPR